mmetsp:Transcript_6027/g.19945  ORF Transcript_6027/g.19945 Transcript_6027/m.19945 type:complete len:490 (-) Transcript_6027:120-1589(-)
MTLARRWRALSLVLCSTALVVELPARPERLDEALAARDAETLLEVDWPPALSYEDRGAAAVDRFLAPRPDWAVMSEPWTGGRLALARRVDAPLAPLMEKFAAEWRARQWSPATCATAGLIANSAPSVLGPVAHAWADELLDAWKRGLALVPRSLKGWGYGMADGSAGALCGGTSGDAPFDPGNRWSCVFLPMTACDEDREYYKDEDRQMRHGFKGAEPVRCSPRLDRRCAAAEFGTPPTPSTFAGRFDAFRGAVAALPESARRGAGDQALVRALAMATLFRPSFRLRKLTRAFDASAFEDGPDACGLVQLRHHARVNLEARGARFAAASFFVDLEDALRDVLPLLRLDTDAPPVLHLLSDDGDMVDDAAKVRPDVATVLPLPASTGMVSSADGLFGQGDLDKQIHTTGLNELARILLSLDLSARCAVAYAGAAPASARKRSYAKKHAQATARRTSRASCRRTSRAARSPCPGRSRAATRASTTPRRIGR